MPSQDRVQGPKLALQSNHLNDAPAPFDAEIPSESYVQPHRSKQRLHESRSRSVSERPYPESDWQGPLKRKSSRYTRRILPGAFAGFHTFRSRVLYQDQVVVAALQNPGVPDF